MILSRTRLSAGDCVTARNETYRIERVLSPGSLGALFLARNSQEQPVVVKLPRILGDELDVPRRERVMLEIDLLHKLREDYNRVHAGGMGNQASTPEERMFPHVVRYVDDGYCGSQPFLVTEFLEGGRVKEVYSSKPATLSMALRYLELLLDTVGFLHSQGIVHRDINPSNLILEPGRDIVLIDFGVAKWKAARYSEVRAGTRLYSAPEQFDEPGKVGEASDLFAIASTTFYVLSAQEPPEITLKTERVKELLGRTNRNIPYYLLTFFETAMNPEPVNRFSSAKLMLDAVTKIKSGKGFYKLTIDGRTFDIFGTVELGRLHDCEHECGPDVEQLSIEIDDPNMHISRHHLRIVTKEDHTLLYDLKSTNGTAVSRKGDTQFQVLGNIDHPQLEGFELLPGDIIGIAFDPKIGPYKTAVFQKG